MVLAQTSAAIVRVGACSPLGLASVPLAMAVRANKLEPLPTPWLDKRSQRVGMVHARFLPNELSGRGRLVRLGAPALAEAARALATPPPLVLGLPEAERPDDDASYRGDIIGELARASAVPVDLEHSLVVRQGHASGAEALAQGCRLLESGMPAVLVGGLDSYYHPALAQWLDESCRLHAPGTENGIIPAEGAAFALLVRDPGAAQGRALQGLFTDQAPAAIARLRAVGTDRDEQSLEEGAPLLATIMTKLVQSAAACLDGRVSWLLSDVNGEYHRVKAWSRVEIRCRDELEQSRHDRLTDMMGDVGAASGALGLAFACALWQAGGAPASSLVVALHAEGAERGVVVAEAIDAE